MAVSPQHAETVGLSAIAWLAGEDDLLPVFLGSTGASEAEFRAGLTDPTFMAAVLDFILMDDAWVERFCQTSGLPPEAPMQARSALPGGEQVHWT